MNATCPTCDNHFVGVDQNEDGSPYIETTRCAHPGCEVYLCGAGCQELSFGCESCGRRVCGSHGLTFGGERFCIACAAEGLSMEPECECRQTDVDLFDARGCELHDPNSPYHVRLRALTAVERLEADPPVVGEPTECPF